MAMVQSRALALLLTRGQEWQETQKLHQAVATYFKLVEYFPETHEALTAGERLLELAQRYEAEGKAYMAVHIYNRLATLPEPRWVADGR